MVRGIVLPLCLSAALSAAAGAVIVAHAGDDPASSGQLTVPWDEFKKLLNLDEDQIVLSIEAFQKLVAQVAPAAAPEYAVQGGRVVLTHEAFQQLVDAMQPPLRPGAKPPFEYLLTKATYSGSVEKRNTAFTGTFHLHVLAAGVFLKIPILPQSIALEDVMVDQKQALVVSENGYHHVVLSTPGEHVVVASFSLRTSLEQGPHRIDLAVQETPITLLRLDLPLKGIEVEIPQAQQLITSASGERTIVSAILAPGRSISIQWRDRVAVAERVPPKLYCEVYHVVSIEDDVLTISSDLNYNILHSEVDKVILAIPAEMNVLAVTGEGLGEWQEVPGVADRRIVVPFSYGRKGAVHMRVLAEQSFADDAGNSVFTGLRTVDTVRETGFVGVEVRTSAEVTILDSEGFEPVGVQKLPEGLLERAVKPLLHGFKYLKHPYSLALSIRKHDKVAVPIATITSANAVTLVTEDGKVIHRVIYQVRNSAKQFLELQLPEKADIWTVFVDGQPVESALNGAGKLLVPLIRSRAAGNNLSSFQVEVVYCLVEKRFSAVGGRRVTLPPSDLLVSQLMWSVYLPNDYTYVRFSSTLEKEKMIQALNVLGGVRRYDDKAMKEMYDSRNGESDLRGGDQLSKAYRGNYQSEFKNIPLGDEQLSSQVAAELEFGRRLEGLAQDQAPPATVSGGTAGTGVLPIQIQVPTGGQVYRFARTIIRTDDPLTVAVTYGRNWLLGAVRLLLLAFVLWLLYKNRGTLGGMFRRVESMTNGFARHLRQHEKAVKGIAQSVMTPFVLLGLVLPSWFLARRLTALLLFLLWLSVLYQFIIWRRRRASPARGMRDPAAPA